MVENSTFIDIPVVYRVEHRAFGGVRKKYDEVVEYVPVSLNICDEQTFKPVLFVTDVDRFKDREFYRRDGDSYFYRRIGESELARKLVPFFPKIGLRYFESRMKPDKRTGPMIDHLRQLFSLKSVPRDFKGFHDGFSFDVVTAGREIVATGRSEIVEKISRFFSGFVVTDDFVFVRCHEPVFVIRSFSSQERGEMMPSYVSWDMETMDMDFSRGDVVPLFDEYFGSMRMRGAVYTVREVEEFKIRLKYYEAIMHNNFDDSSSNIVIIDHDLFNFSFNEIIALKSSIRKIASLLHGQFFDFEVVSLLPSEFFVAMKTFICDEKTWESVSITDIYNSYNIIYRYVSRFVPQYLNQSHEKNGFFVLKTYMEEYDRKTCFDAV